MLYASTVIVTKPISQIIFQSVATCPNSYATGARHVWKRKGWRDRKLTKVNLVLYLFLIGAEEGVREIGVGKLCDGYT